MVSEKGVEQMKVNIDNVEIVSLYWDRVLDEAMMSNNNFRKTMLIFTIEYLNHYTKLLEETGQGE